MLSSRLSSSRFVSLHLVQTRAAWLGQGERVRERVIAALANPLVFGLGSISNSAISPSLRKNEMSLPHSVYQPDPTCVPVSRHLLSPPSSPLLPPNKL